MDSPVFGLELDQILLFGDSLTQWNFNPDNLGWVARFSHAFVRCVDVVNRGYSGFSTDWCLRIFPSTLASILPKSHARLRLVVIFLGTNDAVTLETSHQYVSLDRFRSNIKAMIASVRELHPDARIVLVSPPPMHDGMYEQFCKDYQVPLDRSHERTRLFHQACLDIASEEDIVALNTWSLLLGPSESYDSETLAKYFFDGLHFNAEGNKAFASALLLLIKQTWPELDPDVMLKSTIIPLEENLVGLSKDEVAQALVQNARH
ncbi:SGNH hydrolase-type esterase domain-containing protein [Polychytrium aggregatum]|uniref:SGNH hydrolase-type esterase domain-containing protein n=1 Tax=Polychytrium aggregatum TaxID=110093 RepID=UPI0022FEAC43|nr:SGNH hydrolase-type esterase domain-containing protein [Polychytrium aggregatum]KAI9206234.1 SGNH hydrolase-type esterase domain-containing protein [Polychytrium aggregatum]